VTKDDAAEFLKVPAPAEKKEKPKEKKKEEDDMGLIE